MLRKFIASSIVLAAAAVANADVSLSVSELSGLPAGLVGADVLVTVAPTADWWTVGGIAGSTNVAGASHVYALDPNTSAPILTAPGGSGTPGPAVSFVNLPRDQFSTKRFGANGAANIAGAYLPPAPAPIGTDSEFNVAFLQFPPSTTGADVPDVGAIARVVLDISGVDLGGPISDVYVGSQQNPNDVLLASYNVASATKNTPSPLSTLDFGFYAVVIPEPASLALIALGGLMALRRR